MAISVWSPFSELDRIQREVNRLFENTNRANQGEQDLAQWNPRIDVFEDPERFVFYAELPGLTAQQVNVSIENNLLTLSGERKFTHEDKRQNYHRIERLYGNFRRSFQLPTTVDTAKIQAEMKDGVLTLTLPKRTEVQPKQIKIDVK
jgi:HSP20 family protein